MPRIPNVPDEKIIEAIKANPDATNHAICKASGARANGSNYERIKRLRPIAKAALSAGEPTLSFSDIRKDDRLLRAGKRLIVITTGEKTIVCRKMDGSMEFIGREEFNATAGQYTRVPPGDPQGGPVTTYHIEPGTEPKPSVEDLFKKKPEQLEEKEQAASKTIEAIAKACKLPEKAVSPTTEEALAETAEKIGKQPPRFEDVDYVDPDWGVAQQGGIPPGIGGKVPKPTQGRREYIDRIDQMLDLAAPDCSFEMIFDATILLATRMLAKGIRDEVKREMDRRIRKGVRINGR